MATGRKRDSRKVISLTRFVEQADCTRILDENVHNPIKRSGATLLIQPPKPPPALDYGAIGHAYDYWFRMRVCPVSQESVKAFLGYRVFAQRYRDNSSVARLCRRYEQALLNEARDSLALYEACLFFAKLEAEFRSGVAAKSFVVESHDVSELGRLAAGTDLTPFRGETVVPNPIFCAEGSMLRMMADGDVLVGATLIDLKTSSTIELKRNIRQLIGYVILNELARHNRTIDAVGLYYPRFNYFLRVALRDLMTGEQRTTIQRWFSSQLGRDVHACR